MIVNSNTNFKAIIKNAPWLKKVSLIYNFTDLDYFKPKYDLSNENKEKITLIGVGKYSYQKNIINLVKAFNIIKKKLQKLM